MTLARVVRIVDGRIVCGDPDEDVRYAFAADLMSDVLTLSREGVLFITGLVAPQTIRTAVVADIRAILVVRGKAVPATLVSLAEENEISLVTSPFSMYRASGELYRAGLDAVF